MKTLTKLSFFAILLFLSSGSVFAQGVGTSAAVNGTVIDPAGATVPNATITAVNAERGLRYTATTDENGQYRLVGLPPATYTITLEAPNFQSIVQKNVVLTVGQIQLFDFQLKLASGTQQVEVTGALPAVETERGSQADTIGQKLIQDLPIDRRDYLTFTLLAPGVADSQRLTSDQDFRVKQTPQSGLSFYGSNGRGNSVTIDGGEANDDGGGVRQTMSQDAVQEFQINRSNYTAELGGASGATVNIISKSGTNDFHGSVYGFFRNDAMDARDPFAFGPALQPGATFDPTNPDSQGSPVKNSLNRQQFGGTAGFPIKKDKTFLFLAFEGLRQDAQNSVPLLTSTSIFRPESDAANNQQAILSGLTGLGATPVPCLTGQAAVPAAQCAAILQNVLTINPAASPLSAFLVNQFETNGGVLPYTTRQYLASGRLDHRFNDFNQFSLRYNYGHDLEESPDVQSLTGYSRGSSVHSYDNTLLASWFHEFNARMQNEFRAQWAYYNFDVVPNEPAQVGLDISGFGNFGTNIFLPSLNIERHYEFADNLTIIRGSHTMKMGWEELIHGTHADDHTFFPGRFVFGSLPGGLVSPCLQVPAACGLTGVNPAMLNALQSASLGLPEFYQQGFGNSVYDFNRPYTSLFWQDSWNIRPNLTLNYGLRYELDTQFGVLPTDKDNFAPRVSIAWDPFKDHKTVIRAGYGIFYSPIYAEIGDVVQTLGNVNGNRQIANILVPLTGEPGNPAVSSAAIFQTLFAQGLIGCTTPAAGASACITPANLTPFGIGVSNSGPLPPLTVLFSPQPGYQNPYSQQAELSIEHEFAPGWTFSASYIYVHTLHLPIAIDTNPLGSAPMSTVTLANGQNVSFRNWAAPQCQSNPTACFANPLILQNNVYSSEASALYQGGLFELKKRFNQYFSLMANYTYSKAIDNSTDYNTDYSPQDETNLAAERGLSSFDERHKIVVAGVFDSWLHKSMLSGLQVAPIFQFHTGLPFNLLAGTDVNGDNHYTNDRPLGASRNTGIGPNYASFDLRLSDRIKLREKTTLQFTAEGFNIFNRTNYASVNNIVGPAFGLTPGFTTFKVHGSALVSPSQPLGFTSAFPMREVQLGVRLSF